MSGCIFELWCTIMWVDGWVGVCVCLVLCAKHENMQQARCFSVPLAHKQLFMREIRFVCQCGVPIAVPCFVVVDPWLAAIIL